MHFSLPRTHTHFMASAAVKELLPEFFVFLPDTGHPSCYVGAKLQSRWCIKHLLCISERQSTRTVPFRCARTTGFRLKTCQWLNSMRNFLTSEIAVCVWLSMSHPVYVTWKTVCEQEITWPGYERAGGKQGKEVKTPAKQALLDLCLKGGILSMRNSTRGLACMPRGLE